MKVDTKVYLDLMKERKRAINEIISSRKKYETEIRLVREMGKFPDSHGFVVGDLVMIYHEIVALLCC